MHTCVHADTFGSCAEYLKGNEDTDSATKMLSLLYVKPGWTTTTICQAHT